MEWKPVTIDEVFTIGPGKRLEKRNMVEGMRPFIGASDSNNGITAFVGNTNESLDRNVLGINYNGSVCETFYHPYECVFTDDVKRLHLRDVQDDRDLLLFAGRCIHQQKRKYEYAYKFNEQRMKRQTIILPTDAEGNPDWEYMSTYAEAMRQSLLERYKLYVAKRIAELEYRDIPSLDEVEWGRFKVFADGYLDIATTNSSIDGIKLIDGADDVVPYVTRSDKSNGIARFVSKSNFCFGSDSGGCITVGLDTQTAFWQPTRFVTGQNIQVITGEVLNEHVAMFLIPLFVMQMRAKFNWGGNGATLGRMRKLEMVLPVDADGEPDWEYMEQFGENMMLKKYQQYLDYAEK